MYKPTDGGGRPFEKPKHWIQVVPKLPAEVELIIFSKAHKHRDNKNRYQLLKLIHTNMYMYVV